LQNLIENTIKYSRKEIEPFVDISIRTEDDDIVIVVKDNGQGIPENIFRFSSICSIGRTIR
jgi:signal transduction histidine kinase